jgi:PAS domain S-box-containing protein
MSSLSLSFRQIVDAMDLFMHNPEKRDPRTGYTFLLIFILLSVCILIGGYLGYVNYKENYSVAAEKQLSAVAELKVDQLEDWRKERLGDGLVFYKNDEFSTLVKRFIRNRNDRGAKTGILTWVGQVQSAHRYDLTMLLDMQLNTILVYPENKERVRLEIDQTNIEILLSGNMAFQDFYRNDEDHRIHLKVLVPILDSHSSNRLVAVLALRISPEEHLFPLIKKWPTPSRTSETLIIRRDGSNALFLNDLKFYGDAALNLRIPLAGNDAPAVKAALGQTGIVEGLDYRGVPVIADVRAVPNSPWFIVAKMDVEEMNAPLKERLWMMIVLIGALLGTAGAGVGLVWRRQLGRFHREQYKAAETLRNSEERYRRLFEAARDGILILDAETGMITDVNPFLIEMLGYSHEVFLGKKIWELGLFKDIIANREKFLELQLKEYIRYECLPLETINGQTINVEFVSYVYLVNQCKVIQCNIRDITERKRVEEAVLASEARYRSYIDATGQIGWVTNANGEVEEDVPSLRKFSGQTYEEAKGSGWAKTIHPDDLERTLQVWNNAVAAKSFYEIEYRMRRHDGVYPYLLTRGFPVFREDGSIREWVGTCIDITERKLAAQELQERDARYKTLVENIPQKILMKDRNCIWVSINENLARDFGLRPEEVVGKMDTDLFTPELAAKYHSDDVRIMETGKTEELEEKYMVAGKETWVNTIKTPVRDKNGDIVGLLGIFWDITERKRAEEEILDLNVELEHRVLQRTAQLELANKELEAFSYSVSHDLRAPLRHVNGFVELLGKQFQTELSEKERHYLDAITDSVHQMGVLIDDLLNFSRSGRVDMRESIVDMNSMVKEVSEQIRQDNPGRVIEWTIAQMPSVHCDNAMLHLVWENLLSNAVKFTSKRKKASIEIGVQEEDKEFVFFVRDNGVGFDMRYAQKLFGVFQRLHSAAEFEGTGIGLANVHRIITRHGGRTWAEAELENLPAGKAGGATFYFTLPKHNEEKP